MKLVYSQVERQNPMFDKHRKYLESRLDHLRRENDKHADAERTAYTRGRIAEIKEQLKAMGREEIDYPTPRRRGDILQEA